MKLDTLSDENFPLFAAKHYNNPSCVSVAEFNGDVARFKYIIRILRKYKSEGVIQERLLLNHLIVVHNVFGIDAAKKMCFFRVEKELWPVLKTFLVFLNYLRSDEYVEIPLDPNLINILRKI